MFWLSLIFVVLCIGLLVLWLEIWKCGFLIWVVFCFFLLWWRVCFIFCLFFGLNKFCRLVVLLVFLWFDCVRGLLEWFEVDVFVIIVWVLCWDWIVDFVVGFIKLLLLFLMLFLCFLKGSVVCFEWLYVFFILGYCFLKCFLILLLFLCCCVLGFVRLLIVVLFFELVFLELWSFVVVLLELLELCWLGFLVDDRIFLVEIFWVIWLCCWFCCCFGMWRGCDEVFWIVFDDIGVLLRGIFSFWVVLFEDLLMSSLVVFDMWGYMWCGSRWFLYVGWFVLLWFGLSDGGINWFSLEDGDGVNGVIGSLKLGFSFIIGSFCWWDWVGFLIFVVFVCGGFLDNVGCFLWNCWLFGWFEGRGCFLRFFIVVIDYGLSFVKVLCLLVIWDFECCWFFFWFWVLVLFFFFRVGYIGWFNLFWFFMLKLLFDLFIGVDILIVYEFVWFLWNVGECR